MNSVIERRKLHFESLEQALADAEAMSSQPVVAAGSYSFGQILEHLARTIDIAIGFRTGPKIPLLFRVVAKLLRSRFINAPMKPGFKLPSNAQSVFWPSEEVDTAAGLQHYREAIDRFHQTEPLPDHPLLGKMTRSEQVKLQCRHAELHLSFLHPAE